MALIGHSGREIVQPFEKLNSQKEKLHKKAFEAINISLE